MTDPAADALVGDFLDVLQDELAAVPAERRRELTAEIAGHIAQARAELPDGGDADEVALLLDRIGDPADIARDARDEDEHEAPPQQRRGGWIEGLALVLLPLGGLVIPVIGWFAGVVLLWASNAWTTREKLVGTFVIPGGYSFLLAGTLLVTAGPGGSCSQELSPVGEPIGSEVCTDTGGGVGPVVEVLLLVLLVVLLVAPIASALFLGLRLRRRNRIPTLVGA